MSDIPSWFWMLIIAGLSGMLGLIMYHMAMLLRETTLTVREFRYVVTEMHDIIDTAKAFLDRVNRIADTIENTVGAVSESILKPLAAIGVWMNTIKGVVSRFTGGSPEYD